MTVTIRRATAEDIKRVVAHWRDCDRGEIMAGWFSDDAATYGLAASTVPDDDRIVSVIRCATYNDTPTAIWGAIEIQPTIWTVFAFGTNNWPRVVLSVTRHIRKILIPVIKGRGANAAECWAHVDHEQACRWLERLGARPLGEMPRGKNGEIFRHYIWERDCNEHQALPRESAGQAH